MHCSEFLFYAIPGAGKDFCLSEFIPHPYFVFAPLTLCSFCAYFVLSLVFFFISPLVNPIKSTTLHGFTMAVALNYVTILCNKVFEL